MPGLRSYNDRACALHSAFPADMSVAICTMAKQNTDRSVSDATHAWVEAFLPHLGWVGFDPTNNLLAHERHIRTALGRDYADVPPTTGTYRGHTDSELYVAVQVTAFDQPPALGSGHARYPRIGQCSLSARKSRLNLHLPCSCKFSRCSNSNRVIAQLEKVACCPELFPGDFEPAVDDLLLSAHSQACYTQR